MTAGFEFSGGPETTFQSPGIHQALNFQPFYSFSISPSITHDNSSVNGSIGHQPALPTSQSFEEWDETADDAESSPGGWDDWDQEFDTPSSNSLGQFTISVNEGTVAVDAVDGEQGDSFNDDGFFQFQELVSVMEGLVPKDSERDSKTILNFLKSRRYEERAADHDVDEDDQSAEICAICLSDFEKEEVVATLHNCKHEYHGDCITQWLMRTNACPLCNQYGLKLP